jgi:hypothetical protein
MRPRHGFAVFFLCALLVATSCGENADDRASVDPSSPAQPEQGTPIRVTVPEGDIVTAEDAGFFFIDPATGAAEGWVFSGVHPEALDIGGMTADGRRIVYRILAREDPNVCGSGTYDPSEWVLFDSETGERRELPVFRGRFLYISPDGERLVGEHEWDKVAIAPTANPSQLVELKGLPDDRDTCGLGSMSWARDGKHAALRWGAPPVTLRVDIDSGQAALIDDDGVPAAWSADSALLALTRTAFDPEPSLPAVVVTDAFGNVVWAVETGGSTGDPQWSPDGRLLAVDVLVAADRTADGLGEARVDIFDGRSGRLLWSVASSVDCNYPAWVSDSEVIVRGHGGVSALADLDDGELTNLDWPELALAPSPGSDDELIGFKERTFYAVDAVHGDSRFLAETQLSPLWYPGNAYLYAGDELFIRTPLENDYRDCAESSLGPGPPRLIDKR